MAGYKDKIKDLAKEGKGERLTAVDWTPKSGDSLVGELVHRQIIHSQKSNSTFDRVTIRTDEGVFTTILSDDVLPLANPPVKRGDLLVITAKERKDTTTNKVYMDKSVEVYHVDGDATAPF